MIAILARVGLPALLVLSAPALGQFQPPVGVPAPARTVDESTRLVPEWTVFKHPLGAFMEHPKDWRVEQTPQGVLAMLPPDFAMGQEMVVAFGLPAQGVTDPADPRVGASMDNAIAQMAPQARRAGAPEKIATRAGNGAVYVYNGNGPDGKLYTTRVYVTILDQAAVAISLFADDARVKARQPTVDRIFATVGLGQPVRDPRLVGLFSGEAIVSSKSETSDAYINTQMTYAFLPDGTVLKGAQSDVSMTVRSGDVTKLPSDREIGGFGGTTGKSLLRGIWVGDQGKLYLTWKDGSGATWNYNFEPDGTLVLRDPTNPKNLNWWKRVQ
jgi:hypothetical protein